MVAISDLLNKILGTLFIIFAFLLIFFNLLIKDNQHYVLLAQSFMHGKLYFVNPPESLLDTIKFQGKYYWPNPPFPAVLIMPFALFFSYFGLTFYQGYMSLLLIAGTIVVLYQILKGICHKNDIYFWIYSFIFSTAFIGVAAKPWSWFFAHVVSVFLVFLAYLLFKKGFSLIYIGIIFGLIALTRFTAGLGGVFYILALIVDSKLEKKSLKNLFRNLSKLLIPFIVLLSVLFLYNFARYGTWKDLGYTKNDTTPENILGREYGVFSFKHLPGNLYYLFLSFPKPVFIEGTHVFKFPYILADSWGNSIFLTSPFFLLLFTYSYRRRSSFILLLSVLFISIPILLYFGIGHWQFGYRYSLDFLPYLFILLVTEYTFKNDHLSLKMKSLIILTSLSNLYLLVAIN